MRLLIRQGITIAELTALEAIRRPIAALLTVSALSFVGLMPFLFTHTLNDGARLVRDSALALHFVLGLVLGALTACTALRAELRGGTAAAILTKPVPRPLFFLGKFAGIALVMTAFSLLMTCATLLATRTAAVAFVYDFAGSGPLLAAVALALAAGGAQNFLFRRPFASRTFGALMLLVPAAVAVSGAIPADGAPGPWGAALPLGILPAGALLAMAILLLAGLSLALATRLDIVPTLAVGSAVLMAGLMADYLFGRQAAHSRVYALLDGITPNFQHFWAADALAGDGVPWSYVAHVAAYAALYLAAILSLGIFAFGRMELRG
jgi:ABC-type transport system involved in multi-copper enzyme maturation permease subunit